MGGTSKNFGMWLGEGKKYLVAMKVALAFIHVILIKELFFEIPFYLQSVLVHSANCVKDVYSGM
jgi:hypothetical protein